MRVLAAIGLAALGLPAAALAEDVTFSGSVGNSCSILGHANGTLGVDLTAEGKVMTSELPYGLPASVTLLSVGTNYINVGPASRTDQPAAYVSSGESVQVSYLGAGALAAVVQTWTSSGTSKPVTALIATQVVLNNRITNTSNGFPNGPYQTKTVVTCTPTALY